MLTPKPLSMTKSDTHQQQSVSSLNSGKGSPSILYSLFPGIFQALNPHHHQQHLEAKRLKIKKMCALLASFNKQRRETHNNHPTLMPPIIHSPSAVNNVWAQGNMRRHTKSFLIHLNIKPWRPPPKNKSTNEAPTF